MSTDREGGRRGPGRGEGAREESGASVYGYPENGVPIPPQDTIDYFNKTYGKNFKDGTDYLNWVYGGGEVSGGGFIPATGDPGKTVNTPLAYNKAEPLTDNGWVLPLAVATAGTALEAMGPAAGATTGAAAGEAAPWYAGLTDAAGGSLLAPEAAGAAYTGLGAGGAGTLANLLPAAKTAASGVYNIAKDGSILDTFLKVGAGTSVIGTLLGGNDAADASREAAGAQTAATREAIQFQRDALKETRGDLQPFREAGARQLPGLEKDISSLSELTNDPNKQKTFIENNPFFKLLADDAQSRLFANQAARGKVGSGETAKALQNSLLLLGQDLLNQDVQRKNVSFNQRFNLTTLGENAAAGQGTATMNTANAVSDLTTQGANAAASGIVGAANAKTAGMNSAINSALGFGSILSLSDRTMKKDIHKIGKDEQGLNLYTFKYKGDDKPRIGHMAQDVEKKMPDAVKTLAGIKFIDYGEVHADR